MVFTSLALRAVRPTTNCLRSAIRPLPGATTARYQAVRTLTATSVQQGKVLLVLYDVSHACLDSRHL